MDQRVSSFQGFSCASSGFQPLGIRDESNQAVGEDNFRFRISKLISTKHFKISFSFNGKKNQTTTTKNKNKTKRNNNQTKKKQTNKQKKNKQKKTKQQKQNKTKQKQNKNKTKSTKLMPIFWDIFVITFIDQSTFSGNFYFTTSWSCTPNFKQAILNHIKCLLQDQTKDDSTV